MLVLDFSKLGLATSTSQPVQDSSFEFGEFQGSSSIIIKLTLQQMMTSGPSKRKLTSMSPETSMQMV